jgi:inhibitor of cysteine peptidase
MRVGSNKHWVLSSLLLLVMVFGICGVVYAINSQTVKPDVPKATDKVPELPVVGTVEKLEELLSSSAAWQKERLSGGRTMVMEKNMATEAADQAASPVPAPTANAKADYSDTNVQVQGVDEADIVKTDGSYIYTLKNKQLSVVKAVPANKMKLVSKISFDTNFNPRDIYIDAKHMIVIGDCYRNNPQPVNNVKRMIYPGPPQYNPQTCKAIIYNINDKSKITVSREIELEGNCLSTRKIDSSLYLVSNNGIPYYRPGDPIILPSYRDSAFSKEFQSISCDKINYFPDCVYRSYVIVASVNTDNLDQKVDIKTYLGNGDNIYASTANLYIALTSYPPMQPLLEDSANPQTPPEPPELKTEIYRFILQGASTKYSGQGTVPGTILNQFSMDEHKGYFRIATTTGEVWSQGPNISKNHIYILDNTLKLAGKVENIAPGEKIYSTRFMGDRAYMVTFRNVDPFFVIDLKDPQKPQILGKLKIPGYSDYLHPYDENHIIGFGKDTVEMKGWDGESQAFYQGLKIAVFDVTNVSQPVEMSKVVIGDRGTDSEILNNHKALLFSKEKNLLAFPVTLMEKAPGVKDNNTPAYGSFSFQGAYIYNIDLKNGLQYKGRISHLEPADYQKAGDYWYDSDNNIKRVLYIGNVLYTISPGQIKAHSIADLKLISSLEM